MDELTDYEKALRAWAKYAVIENTSNREMPNIVDCVGKFWVRYLKREEIATLARDSNKEGIPKEHLKRYYAADIIAEAVEPDGVPCYVAVEVCIDRVAQIPAVSVTPPHCCRASPANLRIR